MAKTEGTRRQTTICKTLNRTKTYARLCLFSILSSRKDSCCIIFHVPPILAQLQIKLDESINDTCNTTYTTLEVVRHVQKNRVCLFSVTLYPAWATLGSMAKRHVF
jgi:hypothetical protein